MSDYAKITNFATKDSLPSGNSGKIVKGVEIDDEFNAISGAIASKANTASPAFTGTPTAPTALAGTNTTQLATTAYVRTEVTAATGSLGTMSSQNAASVAITGGTISGTTINTFTVGSNSTGTKTVSTSSPTGGSNGDVWYKV